MSRQYQERTKPIHDPESTQHPTRRLVHLGRTKSLLVILVSFSLMGSLIAISIPLYNTLSSNARRVHRTVNAYVIMVSSNESALKVFDRNVSTPGSPNYGHFLNTKQFADKFGASQSTIKVIENYFASYHMSHQVPWSNRLVLEITGTIANAQQALGVNFHEDKVGDLGLYPQASQIPSLPPAIADRIVAVVGIFPNGTIPALRHRIVLDQKYVLSHNHLTGKRAQYKRKRSIKQFTAKSLPTQPCSSAKTQAYQQGAYLPNQIARLYGMDSFYEKGNLGQGVTAAFPEFTQPTLSSSASFNSSLQQYLKCFSIPSSGISYNAVAGGSGNHSTSNLQEVSLDVENFLSLAPKAKVIVYSSTQANSDLMFMQMASQDKAGLIVSSWGSCEANTYRPDLLTENLAFLEAAAQGQSVMSAAGDDGSTDCWSSGHNTSLSVDDPASQPWVTAVGGVQYNGSLATTPPSVWNDPNYSGGSGGGVSSIWSLPSYQRNVYSNDPEAVHNCSIHNGCRLVPDVSTLSEGFLVHTPKYGWDVIGGTSGATPIFASGIALMESASRHRLGFLNPVLYDTYRMHRNAFVDVTRGNNDYHHVNGGLFHAMVGYDVASGLGTPIFSKIYNDIKPPSFRS